jgi:hypothetical protein
MHLANAGHREMVNVVQGSYKVVDERYDVRDVRW